MFQIDLFELDGNGRVLAYWPVEPAYALRDDAMAIAEFDAMRLSEDGSFEECDGAFHLTDASGRILRIAVRERASVDLAA